MTKHAEIIFETGWNSIVSYEDEEELIGALKEHHRRAMAGEPGSPQDTQYRGDVENSEARENVIRTRPAERIVRVLLYDDHPGNVDPYNKQVKAATLTELISGMTGEDGTVDAEQLIRAMRDEVSPVYPLDQGRQESIYKGKEVSELDSAIWGD